MKEKSKEKYNNTKYEYKTNKYFSVLCFVVGFLERIKVNMKNVPLKDMGCLTFILVEYSAFCAGA